MAVEEESICEAYSLLRFPYYCGVNGEWFWKEAGAKLMWYGRKLFN
jgi:hypothetical protein